MALPFYHIRAGGPLDSIRNLAAAGKIPSAYRLTDQSQWRFDLARVRAWKRKREVKPCRSIEGVRSGGSNFSGVGKSSGDLLAHAIAAELRALRES